MSDTSSQAFCDSSDVMAHSDDDSGALVRAARAGDIGAFEQLVATHRTFALRTAARILVSHEDSEEVVQDSFLLAWHRLHTFRSESSFGTWLHTIVRRRAIDMHRSTVQWSRRRVAGDVGDRPEVAIDRLADPEEHVIARSQRKAAERAIAGLSPRLKDTFLLTSSGELTYEAIARLQGVPVSTVKSRVCGARQIVRARMP